MNLRNNTRSRFGCSTTYLLVTMTFQIDFIYDDLLNHGPRTKQVFAPHPASTHSPTPRQDTSGMNTLKLCS